MTAPLPIAPEYFGETMRANLVALVAAVLSACSLMAQVADPASDAPEGHVAVVSQFKDAASYRDALSRWKSAEDINAWIGAKFKYDTARAMQLSETQRATNGRLPVLKPEDFFAAPSGVCIDLARFAVETLRSIDPQAKPAYLMIEFDPVAMGGNLLRRHWVASFERDGRRYFFADSKRPGHIAGPYASLQDYLAEYGVYRGRKIVSFSEMQSYERTARTPAVKRDRTKRP